MKYVLYLNVGNLPKDKAQEYMQECLKKIHDENFIEPEDKIFCFPVKGEQRTSIEILP
jgi:hypothetical protein